MTTHSPTKDLIPAFQRNARSVFAPLQREFNRFFDELGDGWDAFTEDHFAPRMDVVETKEGLEVSVEVPGLTRDQVKVSADDDVLTISGEKTTVTETSERAARLSERAHGRFSRSIYLPRSVDPSKISATMKDGVLKLFVPKRPGAETKTIEIQSK